MFGFFTVVLNEKEEIPFVVLLKNEIISSGENDIMSRR